MPPPFTLSYFYVTFIFLPFLPFVQITNLFLLCSKNFNFMMFRFKIPFGTATDLIRMDAAASNFLLLFLFSIPIVCCTSVKDIKQHENQKLILKTTTFTSTTVANPATVTVSPGNSSPGIVTVTPTPPVTVSPATPTTNPSPAPPATTPVTPTPTTPTGGGAPPAATSAPPAASGQSWCVAKSGATQASIQAALDYACGTGGVDCSAIQPGASCYNPNTLQNHASYAFNSYYQKNPVQTSCDFGGSAVITNANPSSGSCTFTTKSSSSTPPTTTTPSSPTTTTPLSPPTTTPPSPTTTTPPSSPTTMTTPPSTSSSTGTPPISSSSGPPTPTTLNGSNPVFGLGGATTGFGDSPPTTSNSSISMSSTNLQPFISCIIVVFTSVITGWMIV